MPSSLFTSTSITNLNSPTAALIGMEFGTALAWAADELVAQDGVYRKLYGPRQT